MSESINKAEAGTGADGLTPLQKIDSGVHGLSSSPPKEKGHRRASSMVAGVASIKDLKESKTPIKVAKETQGTGWKINSSSATVEDKDILKLPFVQPLVRAIDLHFQHGVVVTARNRLGVTIKDALDAIHKPNKKRADDELELPYLKGFEWLPDHPQYQDDEAKREAEWDRLYIHLSATGAPTNSGGGKKKKNKGGEE